MPHAGRMKCFVCDVGVELSAGGRVGFRDCCESCDADLHCCKNCRFYDPAAYNECRESSAERVFSPPLSSLALNQSQRFARSESVTRSALSDLDALFKK
jgi:hypothetical protein